MIEEVVLEEDLGESVDTRTVVRFYPEGATLAPEVRFHSIIEESEPAWEADHEEVIDAGSTVWLSNRALAALIGAYQTWSQRGD